MALPEHKKKLLKAKIAVALHDELGRVPKKEEIDQVYLHARVLYKAILGCITNGRSRRRPASSRSSKQNAYAHRLCQGLHKRTKPQFTT